MLLSPKSSIGKKLLMAITGQVMVLFIILHLIGNSTIYFSWLNAYAEHLHALPPLVWAYRIAMVILLLLHVLTGIQLYLENRSSKPQSYAVKKSLVTTFAGKTMIWTGLFIGVFLIYHLLHFTLQVTDLEISAAVNLDAMGRPDVVGMVVSSFQSLFISLVYIVAMIAILLHLTHGIQSSFQTLGLNNEKSMPVIVKKGSLCAFLIFLGFISVPILIYFGMMKG